MQNNGMHKFGIINSWQNICIYNICSYFSIVIFQIFYVDHRSISDKKLHSELTNYE